MRHSRILLVEKDPVFARYIESQLSDIGYLPMGLAASQEQAIALGDESKPDLVLVDIGASGVTEGLGTADAIRARFSVPVLCLAESANDARHIEPFECILKPFSKRELQAVLELALYKHRAEASLRECEQRIRSMEASGPESPTLSIDERKRTEAALRLSDLCLRAVSQGVIITGPDHNIHTVNKAFEAITGYAGAELLGRNCRLLQGPLSDPDTIASIHHALDGLRPFNGEVLNYRKDGSAFWNDLSISPVRDALGEPLHFIGITRDVTGRKSSEIALRESSRQLKASSQRVLEVMETERRRVAHELHDELGQALTAIKINLQASERFRGQSPAEINAENIRIIEGALEQVHRMALALRPSMLDDLGLLPALRWITDQAASRSGFAVKLHYGSAAARLPPLVETACFRIVQEALTNIARHSKASEVEIDLDHKDETLVLCVHDNGRGFDVVQMRARSVTGGSFGLLGMQERAALLGGTLDIRSSPGQGCTLRLRCPLHRQGEAA